MDRQCNETNRLNHESKSSLPSTLSTWYIEDDAADLFTRIIFYKVQEEIIASCLDMQIKRMSDEVNGVLNLELKNVKIKDKSFKVSVSRNHAICSCKKFMMCGIVCRHSFCGLKQIGVMKFPRSLVLNRWTKTAGSGLLTNSSLISNDYFKMEQVSLKLTNIWFDFCQVLNKAGVEMDKLNFIHTTIKQLNSEVDNMASGVAIFTKKDHIAAMVGEQPEGEITVLPPNVCKNKGNYFKATRLVSEREKALTKAQKRIHKCKKCAATTHDARTCPKKKNDDVELNSS